MPELGTYTVTLVLKAQEEISSATEKARKAMDEMEKSSKKLSSTLSDVGKIALGVVSGLIGFNILSEVKNWVMDSIKAFTAFETASVRLASVSASAGENVRLLAAYFRVEASAAARKFAVSGQEAISALEALIKAGLQGAEATKALGAALMMAKIEGVDFQTAANNLVQVMAQFGIKGSEATRVVDALVNASRLGIGTANDFAQGLANVGATARGLGLSLEDTTAWLVILERRFGSAQEAGTHLNRFLLELYEIAGKLGVPIRDVNGNLRNTNEIILDVVNAARTLGGDFQTLQERLAGVDMRAVKALLTFTQMNENFSALVENIRKAGVALKAFEDYMNTAQGQMDRTNAEIDRMQRITGNFFANIWVQAQKLLLPALEAMATAWSGIASTIMGEGIPALESWLNAQRMLGRLTDEQIADMIADWAQVGEVVLRNGKIVTITLEDAARMAEHLGVSSEKLTSILTDTAAQVGEYFSTLQKQGQLTKDVVEGTLMALVMDGKLTVEQAEELAKKFGYLDENVRKNLRTMAEFGETTKNVAKTINITGDAVESLAKKYGLNAEKIVELINKTLGLNISYDEHSRKVRELMEAYGLTEEQAYALISALEKESEAAKKAAEAEKEHAKMVEDARNVLQSSIQALLNYGAVYGPMTENINKAREALNQLASVGESIPSSLTGFLDFMQKLNEQFASLERQAKAVSAAQQVAAVGASYYSTIVSIQEGLIADQIVALQSQIDELKRQEEALRTSGEATKEQINSIRQQRAELELQLQSLRNSIALTEEQAASQMRLDAIQKMLGFTTQILNLQQTALQLALLGATDASNNLMNVSLLLADALSDGIVTSSEYKTILEALGITFDATGSPVINLKNIMEEFRQKVIETQQKVEDFRSSLKSLDGMTVHTYHYHHVITVGGEEKPAPPRKETEKAAEKLLKGLPPAQHGVWFTSEGAYYLHRGEMVLPRNVAEWFRSYGPVAATRNVNVSVNVNATSVSDPHELAEIISRELVRRLRGLGM